MSMFFCPEEQEDMHFEEIEMMNRFIEAGMLPVSRSLAHKLGLRKAIIFQHLYNIIQCPSHTCNREGRTWVSIAYFEWHPILSQWPHISLIRTFYSLVKEGLITRSPFSNRCYSIDMEKIESGELGISNSDGVLA